MYSAGYISATIVFVIRLAVGDKDVSKSGLKELHATYLTNSGLFSNCPLAARQPNSQACAVFEMRVVVNFSVRFLKPSGRRGKKN